MEKTKKCPQCGADIKAVAKKCRYCGTWLDQEGKPTSSKPNPQNVKPTANSSVGTNNKARLYILIACIVIAIIAIAVWFLQADSNSPQTDSNVTETSYSDNPIYERKFVVEEVAEVPETENENTNAPTNILSLESMMNICGKKRNEAIAYLKSQGLSPKDGGRDYEGKPIYYFEIPNGTISINNEGQPHVGTGSVEFLTTSRTQYNEWVRQLKAANYHQENDDTWCGDNAHYYTFRLINLLDAPEEDDCCGTATLCVMAFPMVYDEKVGHYVDFEYKY